MTENATSVDKGATEVRFGVTPDNNALATIIILIVTIGVVIVGYRMHRAEKQRQRDAQLAAMESY